LFTNDQLSYKIAESTKEQNNELHTELLNNDCLHWRVK